MTAFVASNGADNFFDTYTGGSVNATLDTYTISGNSRLVVRTDTYSCPNHTVAFGSIDTVTFTGQGGTLHFDPTYVKYIAYTGGSGVSPAYGTVITSTGGATGVFLGAWTTWQVEPIVAGGTITATGFIKLGNVVGTFAAGALTGITATCSGPEKQGWIEVRGPDTGTITVPRIGKVTSTEAWFDLGTTTGVRGQILPCPTTATVAGVFPGVWIETGPGTGIYDRYSGAGSQVAAATTPTDSRAKIVWQAVTGIRIGNDGTNAVGFLPPAGCNVRIPATILTNCTRNATTGSGPRVLPNATIATRQEFITTGAGYFDLRNLVCQWYMNFTQAFYVKYLNCAVNDSMVLSEIAAPLDVDNCIVSPTQAQLNFALNATSCFAGGVIKNTRFTRFSLAAASAYTCLVNYLTDVIFTDVTGDTLTLRANATTGIWNITQAVNCSWVNCTVIGGRISSTGVQSCTFTNLSYADSYIATTATNPFYAIDFGVGSANNVVDGGKTLDAIVNTHPYNGWVNTGNCYNLVVKNIGTFGVPFNCGSANAMGVGLNASGNNAGIKFKRCYFLNTRTGPYAFVNSDTDVLIENVAGDYADTSVIASLNAVVKNCALTGATTGQISVYGSHWLTRFTSATAGMVEIICNEPTSASALQCFISGGTPQFNSSGSVLLTKIGDSVTWEMPYFGIGYTAFTNSAPVVTGTNVTFGTRWGNHDIEFQIDTGSGYNGIWLNMTAANLILQSINSTVGFKLKVRATCAIAAATNVLTNIRINTTTTSIDQSTKLYPLQTVSLQLTGLQPGSDVIILSGGTPTILASADSIVSDTYSYVYETLQNIDIGIVKPNYIPLYIRNYPLGSSNATLPISQQFDRNYGA